MKRLYSCLFLLLGICSYTNAQTTVTTGLPNSVGSGSGANYYLTFIIQNTNSYAITITDMEMYRAAASNGNTFTLFYNPTTLSGPPALPTGWTMITSTVLSAVTTTAIHPTFTNVNFTIPANTTYRFAVQTNGTALNYGGSGNSTNTFTNGGVTIGTGNYQINSLNVGYWGPSTNPRFWCGTITFVPALSNCTGTPTAGTAAAPSSACPNTSFNLSLTGQTNASGITIQWQSSPAGAGTWTPIAGATTANYTVTGGISAATDYRALVTCTSNSTSSYSNTAAVGLSAVTTPTISIAASANNICSGASVTYTATTNVTGGTIQWKVNGGNVGTNSTTYSYSPANGNVVTATLTVPSTGCYSTSSVNSNSITMNVTTSTNLTMSIAGSASLCAGNSATYTATTNITGGTYQWKVDNVNVGTNSPTYTHTASNSFNIQCVLTPPAGCYSPAVGNSNTITVVVSPYVTPTVSVTPSANNICVGASVNFTAASNITGGSYQWKVNNVNVGTNSTTYSYNPANNDQVTVQLTNPATGCFTANNVSATPVTMSVIPITTPVVSISVDSNNICHGKVATFTAATNITGATFQWKVNNVNIGTSTPTYSYPPSAGDVVHLVATVPAGSCYSAAADTSNAVSMNVIPNAVATASLTGSSSFCKAGSATYTAVTNIASASYQWQVNGMNTGGNSASLTYNPADNDQVQCIVTVTAGCYTTSFASTNILTVKEKPIPTPMMIAGTGMLFSNYPIGNDWFRNDTLIYSGLVIKLPDTILFPSCYHLRVTNNIGCSAKTADTCLMPTPTNVPQLFSEAEVTVHPNPTTDVFNITSAAENGVYFYELTDVQGRRLAKGQWNVVNNKISEKLSLGNYTNGIYFLTIKNEKGSIIRRVEKSW